MNTAERILAISKITSIKSYLEIGVSEGETFNNLDIDYKVAVDPHFQFDVSSFQTEHVRFYQMTSDKYFLNFAGKDIFDLIFIDGLHIFQQTFRDFINALFHMSHKSIVIIDDVYPNDIFSSLVNDHQRFRRLNNPENSDLSWHGDVYKTIFAIHDLCPKISYITINWGQGNPQAICFIKPRIDFKQKFKSIESIERLTYFDLLNNLDVLNLVSEEEAFEIINNFISDEDR